ncbi:MAG: carbohydrate kinase [Opitutales bacterium]|nr:carbohydrate kinase [Opitutales bacterium]
MYLLGIDIGSSSIKVSLVDAESKLCKASAQEPDGEAIIRSPQPGFAEQDPNEWWQHIVNATKRALREGGIDGQEVAAIGIAYQMHGLVCVDKNQQVLRPSIIWCDSRAVEIGNAAFADLGAEKCLSHLLNSPGNFTASKLKWVKDNEPELYAKIDKIMLPGDFAAMKLTGDAVTTVSGLSEGMFWDFAEEKPAKFLLEYYGLDEEKLCPTVPTFGHQGSVCAAAARELGLKAGIPVSYRAGDQPNNALSLNVFESGDIAATGGTSGVVYGVSDLRKFDPQSRVNTFAHVNHSSEQTRLGVLLCVNGTGILNSWVRRLLGNVSYKEMDDLARSVAPGSEGLCVLPFGNGAERMLENRNIGAAFAGLDFNRHNRAHMCRAAQEGIAFSFIYGIEIMKEMGVVPQNIRAGKANLFLCDFFRETLATLSGAEIDLLDTDGSAGAARGAGFGAGIYKTREEAFGSIRQVGKTSPVDVMKEPLQAAYANWKAELTARI